MRLVVRVLNRLGYAAPWRHCMARISRPLPYSGELLRVGTGRPTAVTGRLSLRGVLPDLPACFHERFQRVVQLLLVRAGQVDFVLVAVDGEGDGCRPGGGAVHVVDEGGVRYGGHAEVIS